MAYQNKLSRVFMLIVAIRIVVTMLMGLALAAHPYNGSFSAVICYLTFVEYLHRGFSTSQSAGSHNVASGACLKP